MARKPKPVALPAAATMTTKHYLLALEKLGLTPSGLATCRALGLKIRAVQRMGAGEVRIPGPVALLLRMYVKHGIPEELA